MENLFVAILAIVGAVATVIALLVTLTLFMPRLTGRVSEAERKMPVRSFALGFVNFLFFFVLAAVMAQIGESIGGAFGGFFTLLAVTIALFILSLMSIGLAGLVALLSERLGGEPTPGRTLRAALLLVAAGFAPVVGWLVLTPLALLTGLGATIIALIRLVNRKLVTES